MGERRCYSCYQNTVPPGYKYCIPCTENPLPAISHLVGRKKHHEAIMELAPPKGYEISRAAAHKGLDKDIVKRLTELHRDVCEQRNTPGAVQCQTPDDYLCEIMGDPDDYTGHERIELERLHVSYLSASMTAATWLGYYLPRSKYDE